MGLIITPRNYITRPSVGSRIDRNHPLTYGLVSLFMPWSLVDLANEARISFLTSGSFGSLKGETLYSSSTSDGGAVQYTDLTRWFPNGAWKAVTALMRVYITSISSYGNIFSWPNQAASWNSPYCNLGLQDVGGGGTMRFYGATAVGGIWESTNASFTRTIGAVTDYGFKQSTLGSGTLYKDGTFIDAGGVGGTDSCAGTNTNLSYLNRNGGAVGDGTNGHLHFCALWKRELSKAEIVSFYNNPYQIFSMPRRYWFGVGVGGVTISPVDLLCSDTLDVTTITQNHIIALQELLCTPTIDTTTITQNHVITLNDLLCSVDLDTTIITQNHVISLDDLLCTTSLDPTTIELGVVIIPADMLCQPVFDATSITQNHVLTLQDLLCSSGLDVTDITQNHIISLQDLLCSVTLDNATITVEGEQVIVVQDLFIGQRKLTLVSIGGGLYLAV